MRWLWVSMVGAGCVSGSAAERVGESMQPVEAGPDGAELFSRVWQPHDPRSGGDGLGPLYNAASCEACHFQGGIGGSGGSAHNVELMVDTDGVATVQHKASTLEDHTTASRLGISGLSSRGGGGFILGTGRGSVHDVFGTGFNDFPSFVSRNTPALFGIGALEGIDEAAILENAQTSHPDWPEVTGRPARTATGEIGRLGWKGEVATVAEFVEQACSMELGLETEGFAQPAALQDETGQSSNGIDMTAEEVTALADFVSRLPAPTEGAVGLGHEEGRALFSEVGCDTCHTPTLGDVQGVYSDLLLHDMGPFLSDKAFGYGMVPATAEVPAEDAMASQQEWRTPPLWGLRDSAPYLHDGRSETIAGAISQHSGEAEASQTAWMGLSDTEQAQLLAFLSGLKAPA